MGATVARILAEHGVETTLYEKRFPGAPPRCAGLVGKEWLDKLLAGTNFSGSVVNLVRGFTVHSPTNRTVFMEKGVAQAYVLSRRRFNELLLSETALSGAKVEYGVKASLYVEEEKVRGVFLRGAKQGLELYDLVVGAWGFAPPPGLPSGLRPSSNVLVAAQCEMSGVEPYADDFFEVFLGFSIAPKGFAYLIPLGNGWARVGVCIRPGVRRSPSLCLDRFVRFLVSLGVVEKKPRLVNRFVGAIRLGPPARTASKGLVLVGEAAGQTKPITGGGINFGLRSAKILAETILGSGGEEEMFVRYEERWRAALWSNIKVGLLARRLADLFVGDWWCETLVDILADQKIRKTILEEVGFDTHQNLLKVLTKNFGRVAARTLLGCQHLLRKPRLSF